MIASPPGRIAPLNDSFSERFRASNFDVFTEEIEKSTMNSANIRVIMSAKETSQRSSFSCSSSSWEAWERRGRRVVVAGHGAQAAARVACGAAGALAAGSSPDVRWAGGT